MPNETDCFEGGCTCGHIRYRMTSKPLFVHCCHCTWCQRESGAAFAMNALIEMDRFQLLQGKVSIIKTPTKSGKGQQIARCPQCHVAIWSHYAMAGKKPGFVRVGTLDNPAHMPPDIHIFTKTKQAWIVLPPDTPAVSGYYQPAKLWPEDSLKRYADLLGKK